MEKDKTRKIRFGKYKYLAMAGLVLFVIWLFCLPGQLFKVPTSTVVVSKEGQLLGARIAKDGQWRFPETDSIPHRFRESIVLFEDQYFYSHPGINPVSTFKAFWNNLTSDKRRGGSTITQQVIRLAHQNPKRTYWEKLIESFQATRLEWSYSKEEILNLYASHAPFGSNVVGLSAASWRYFGIPAEDLSWAQSATLAVLPNAPALIYPGKNEILLKNKRDFLLRKLHEKEIIDETTYELALMEDLPGKPISLPDWAPHFTEKIRKQHTGQYFESSIDFALQRKMNQIVETHYRSYSQNHIHNMAVLVLDNETRQVLGYVGNTPTDQAHQNFVDIIGRPRSTGSILKPFLYAAMLDAGELLPDMLVKDIPTNIDGYTPKNYDKKYRGAVPASLALTQSLNVPAVRMLQEYGLDRFSNKLRQTGQKHINKSADHYGLSLILGGAESSLWDITKAYAAMAHSVTYFNQNSATYLPKEYTEPVYAKNAIPDYGEPQFEPSVFNAGATYTTLEVLRNVNRPNEQANWEYFESSQPIAWKTGTSYGFKDAWAVGSTSRYTIGVWVGNASGEGRPGLVGVEVAAPVMFDVLSLLPSAPWFQESLDDLVSVEICQKSGYPAQVFCEETRTAWIPKKAEKMPACPYHHRVFLNATEQYQVNSSCYALEDMQVRNWFSLPPVLEYYYQQNHPAYRPLPPFQKDCLQDGEPIMDFIYPKANQQIILPKNFEEELNEVIFKLAHRGRETTVYWYLDDRFLGFTKEFHEIALVPEPGEYILKAIDQEGREVWEKIRIEVTQ